MDSPSVSNLTRHAGQSASNSTAQTLAQGRRENHILGSPEQREGALDQLDGGGEEPSQRQDSDIFDELMQVAAALNYCPEVMEWVDNQLGFTQQPPSSDSEDEVIEEPEVIDEPEVIEVLPTTEEFYTPPENPDSASEQNPWEDATSGSAPWQDVLVDTGASHSVGLDMQSCIRLFTGDGYRPALLGPASIPTARLAGSASSTTRYTNTTSNTDRGERPAKKSLGDFVTVCRAFRRQQYPPAWGPPLPTS